MSQAPLPAARSFTVRNPRHQITGLSLGGDNPTVLDVIIGVTPGETTLEAEHEKARAAAALGVLMVTDVTSDGDGALRRRILGDDLDLVFRTVPTYEIYRLLRRCKGTPRDAGLTTLEAQGEEGVDFITIHGSTSVAQIRALSGSTRAIPMTSRGGAMMAEIMQETRCRESLCDLLRRGPGHLCRVWHGAELRHHVSHRKRRRRDEPRASR